MPEVLDGVVLIDVEVAGGGDRQVERAVTREQLEHVVEEPDAGADVVAAAAVERQLEMNLSSRWSSGRSPRGAQDLLDAGDASLRVGDHAGGDPDAPGAPVIVRPVADVDAAPPQAVEDTAGRFTEAGQDEVRRR